MWWALLGKFQPKESPATRTLYGSHPLASSTGFLMGRSLVILMFWLLVIWATAMSSACSRQGTRAAFPIDQVELRTADVKRLAEDIRFALEEVEFEMMEAFSDVPPGAFEAASLPLVRYALLSCFTAPLCQPGDPLPICVRRNAEFDPSALMAVQLDERPPVYGYRACALPPSADFVTDVPTWSSEGLDWFRKRVVLIDSLRVRLKAIIPIRLQEIDVRLDNYDVDLKQLHNRAEDVWREAQRVEKRAEHRRRDEEQWESFRLQMLRLEENLALIRVDVERLREHQRQDIRDVAVRIATFGTNDF